LVPLTKGGTYLRVFENRVLRKMYGSKREEVAGGWRRLHNEEVHNLYASSHTINVMKSRRMRWADHVERMGDMRNVYRVLVGKRKRKSPLGRPKRRWENNIRIYLLIRKDIAKLCTGYVWLRIWTSGGLL
jgi:hypothetical protein